MYIQNHMRVHTCILSKYASMSDERAGGFPTLPVRARKVSCVVKGCAPSRHICVAGLMSSRTPRPQKRTTLRKNRTAAVQDAAAVQNAACHERVTLRGLSSKSELAPGGLQHSSIGPASCPFA